MIRESYFLIIASLLGLPVSAQQTPEALGKLWVEAIKTHSVEKIKPLIHPHCPRDSVKLNILERMVDGELPHQFTIETTELGPKNLLEKIYIVIPDKQLNLKFITKTPAEKKRFGLGKGFPITKLKDLWFFAICSKSK